MSDRIYEIMQDSMNRQNKGKEGNEVLITIYERLIALNEIARKEGLLALEDEVRKMAGQDDNDTFDDYFYENLTGTERLLAVLISLIVEGTEPKIVEQVAVSRYFASYFEGQAAVIACMIIIGALVIQTGESTQILKQQLLAMMPEKTENMVIAREKEMIIQKKNKQPDIPEDFFQAGLSQMENSSTLKAFAQLIASMENLAIQRLLREVDNRVLEICLKGADGQTRKKFFNNMSGRIALMIYEDICYMGPIRLIDVETEAVKIMDIIRMLEDQGEIALQSSILEGKTIEDMIALQEHKILCQNREIEYKIKELQLEISKLERQIVKI